MISPEEAWQRLEPFLTALPGEPLARRRARGRVLCQPTAATVDVPPTDVSAMDGYAVAGEVRGLSLPVAATVAAGDAPGASCPAGGAVRIMTGAPLPRGADRVVPVELTDGGARQVLFRDGTVAGAHIRRQAEIVAAGDPLLPAGAVVSPGALALLATHGIERLSVHRAPRVRLLVTGDEVVPPESVPAPGQLRDSHTDFLLAAGLDLGLDFETTAICPDRRKALALAIGRGLEADVLLITGGVSKGEFDHAEEVLDSLGCEALFNAVAIQPGKPLVVAHHPGGLVFGLPGNPGSVMAAFWLFVRPVLRRLMGHSDGFWQGALAGVLAGPLPGARGRDRFLPARVEITAGVARVTPSASRGSHDLMATAGGMALVRIPAEAPPAAVGAPCQFLIIGAL